MKIKKERLKISLLAAAAAVIVFPLRARGAFEYGARAARQEGMGGVYVALADDASTVFHNPAGLSYLYSPEILTGYSGLFLSLDEGELSNSLACAAYPFQRRLTLLRDEAVGMGWTRLQAGDLYSEDTFVFGYGGGLSQSLRVGVGLKLFSVGYGEDKYTRENPVFDSGYSQSAVSADFGMLYRPGIYSLGLGVYNLNSPDTGLEYLNEVPLSVKGGLNIAASNSNVGLQGEYRDGDITLALGGEKQFFSRHLSLRGGLRIGSRNYRTASMGLSYTDSWYKIDYALIYPMAGVSGTLGTHKLNLSFYLGERVIPEIERPEREPEDPEVIEIPEIPGVSVEEIKSSRELANEAEVLIERGELGTAMQSLEESLDIWEDNRNADDIKRLLEPVADVYANVDQSGKKNDLVFRALSAYFDGRGKEAINRIRYAAQLWPEDNRVQRMKSVIEKRFSSLASQMQVIPGLNVVEQKLQEVLEAIYDRRWVRAISLCEEVLDLDSENVLALKRMGSAYFGMGNKDKGREIWERALEVNPNDRELQEYLGIREPDGGSTDRTILREFENAVNYYNKLVEAGADNSSRIQVLERIITTYKDSGVDISSLEDELNRLRN